MLHTIDLQVAVHMQPAEVVALRGDLVSQRARTGACGPDHGLGVDALAAFQGDAFGVHRRHTGAQLPRHAELGQRLGNHRARPLAQVRTDLAIALHQDDAHCGIGTEHLAQPRRHLGRGLDAGEPGASYHHGIARHAVGAAGQPVQMRLQPRGIGHLVDVEGMRFESVDRRTEQPAAGGQHQAVIAERLARGIGAHALHRHFTGCHVNAFDDALHEPHTGGGEDLQQRRLHLQRVLLVEPGAHVQRRLRRDQHDFHIGARGLVEQTGRSKGAPHAGKAGANDKNALGHLYCS
ncbi:hypothetical protein D3C72_1135830 [compost metagenome]